MSCDWDNGKCDGPIIVLEDDKEYDEDIKYEKDPFVVSGVAILALIGSSIWKLVFKSGFLNLFVVAIWGVIEFIGWSAVLILVGVVDTKHGRELLETDDTEILISFGMLAVILIVNWIINIIFVILYNVKIVKKDVMHKIWIR